MEKNILKANSQAGKTTFYMFEIAALAVGALFFVIGIVVAALGMGFWAFLEDFALGAFLMFALYGLGRVIDLLYYKSEKCAEKKKEE